MKMRVLPPGRLVQSRRQYRRSHSEVIDGILSLATLNVQGLSWSRVDNKLKLRRLVQDARENHWHCLILSDLHLSVRTQSEVRLEVVCIEEFVLLQRGKVGFLLSQCMLKVWNQSGRRTVHLEETDRLLAMAFKLHDREYVIGAGYCPTQSKHKERLDFFTAFNTLEEKCRKSDVQIWAGDWNTHFRQDSGYEEWCGPFCLHTPTVRRHEDMLESMQKSGMRQVDSCMPCRHRGTWFSHINKKYYENDYFVCNKASWVRRFNRLRTVSTSIGDHYGKAVHLQVAPAKTGHYAMMKRSRSKHAKHASQANQANFVSGFDGQLQARSKLRLDRMRGPSQ